MADNQVLTELASLYGEMRDGYATADATVSLQSIFDPQFFSVCRIVSFVFPLVLTAAYPWQKLQLN